MTSAEAAPPLIRAFIAIEIDPGVRAALSRAQAKLKRSGAHVSWVPEDNLHISLVFLGDVPVATVELLSDAINSISASRQSFQCNIENVGSFGRPASPRVIWAGVRPNELLANLQHQVSQCVRQAGITLEDRPYKAHVTLGRVRSSRGRLQLVDAMSSIGDISFGTMTVSCVVIMRSILGDVGATYRVLHACPLGQAQAR
jgi:2'-5' RNA ligase